jgi:hypothetical protein
MEGEVLRGATGARLSAGDYLLNARHELPPMVAPSGGFVNTHESALPP